MPCVSVCSLALVILPWAVLVSSLSVYNLHCDSQCMLDAANTNRFYGEKLKQAIYEPRPRDNITNSWCHLCHVIILPGGCLFYTLVSALARHQCARRSRGPFMQQFFFGDIHSHILPLFHALLWDRTVYIVCYGKRQVCSRNQEAGCYLGESSLLVNIWHLSILQ